VANRHAFEEAFAAVGGQTLDDLKRRGWWSGRRDGDWRAVCVPPGTPPEKEREILAGLINPARFGETPPTNGGGD
jgi:hypothetical protein